MDKRLSFSSMSKNKSLQRLFLYEKRNIIMFIFAEPISRRDRHISNFYVAFDAIFFHSNFETLLWTGRAFNLSQLRSP